MNFYPTPPVITAKVHCHVPDNLRCVGDDTEWTGSFTTTFQHIFLEGPTADGQGKLFFVDIPYGRILVLEVDGNVRELARWDGEPNGLALRQDGILVIADYKQGILSFDPSTSNQGNLYFTDQGQTGMTDQTGKVYRYSPDGKLDTLVENGVSPNGLVLSLDEKFLYVAMTRANQVWRLPLHEDGTVTKAGVFFQSFGNAGPDGLCIDEEGSLFICHPSLGTVFVVDRHVVPKARIASGSPGINLTNCTFGGPSNKTLFITDSIEGNKQTVE